MTLTRHRFKPAHLLGALLLFVACLCPAMASAQSIAVGFGLGFPLMNYFNNEVDRDYRITPSPGYYPVLKKLENAYGSMHFNASLILNLDLPVDLEIRFDAARMRWRRSKVTHVSCTPVDVIDGKFSDASATYYPLNKVPAECLDTSSYQASKDISSEDRSSLWFFHISGGARYSFYKTHDWNIFTGAHLGFTIATTIDSKTWLGANIDALIGVMYRLSDLIWIELDAKLLFAITHVPEDPQTRINHETQTGGNILSSLVQPESYIDFQLSIRFDLSDI